MRRRNLFLLLLPYMPLTSIYAQDNWTKQDSIWLQRILSGKESLQLNDEIKKNIESGTFLFPGPYMEDSKRINPHQYSMMKSFDGITNPQGKRVEPHELPPPVYILYSLGQKDSLPDASRSVIFYDKFILELKTLDALTPRKATVDDPTTLNVPDDILQTILRTINRTSTHNKKHARAWETYNNGY